MKFQLVPDLGPYLVSQTVRISQMSFRECLGFVSPDFTTPTILRGERLQNRQANATPESASPSAHIRQHGLTLTLRQWTQEPAVDQIAYASEDLHGEKRAEAQECRQGRQPLILHARTQSELWSALRPSLSGHAR